MRLHACREGLTEARGMLYSRRELGRQITMTKPENEKRAFVRVPFRIGTTIRTGDRTIWSGNTLDISLNGLRVATTETVPPEGTFCEVEIVLAEVPEPVIIEARGSIVRSQPGTLAVHFSEVDVDSYEHLRQLILNNSEDPERAEKEFDVHWGIRTTRPPEKP
jgi:hypothetical protein